MQIRNPDGTYTPLSSLFEPTTLPEYKEWKKNKINEAYNQALTHGFTSSATGVSFDYAYAQNDQWKFIKVSIDALNGNVSYPIPIPSKTQIVMHNQEQYQQLTKDISNFEWTNQMKLHTLYAYIDASTSIDQCKQINW